MNPIKELSLPNYTAIAFLENLGISDPNQKQINITETMITMVTHPEETDPETIRQCVGDNNLAYYFLFIKTNEWCKLKRDEEFLIDWQEQMDGEEEIKI
jgi:hypothetical protein